MSKAEEETIWGIHGCVGGEENEEWNLVVKTTCFRWLSTCKKIYQVGSGICKPRKFRSGYTNGSYKGI